MLFTIPHDVRRFVANATVALLPIGALSQIPWYETSMRALAFVAALALALSAATSIYLFFRARGGEVWKIWNNLLDLPVQRRRLTLAEARQKAFQDASCGVYTFEADVNGGWIWTSDSLEDLLHARPDQLVGSRWLNFVVDERDSVREQMERVVDSAVTAVGSFDQCVKFRHGTTHVIMEPATDVDGQVIGFLGRMHPCLDCHGGQCARHAGLEAP